MISIPDTHLSPQPNRFYSRFARHLSVLHSCLDTFQSQKFPLCDMQADSRLYSLSHSSKSNVSPHFAVVHPSSSLSITTTSFGSRNRIKLSEWVATISCVRCAASRIRSDRRLSNSGCKLTSGSSIIVTVESTGLCNREISQRKRSAPSESSCIKNGFLKFFSFHVNVNIPAATGGKLSDSKLGNAALKLSSIAS